MPGLMMTVRSGAGLAPLPMPLAGRDPDLLCMLGPLPGTIFAYIHADPPRPQAYAARPRIF